MNNTYINIIQKQIGLLEEEQVKLEESSKLVQEVITNDGLIYIFGCGHSHMFAEEFFYRAGGLANVVPILYEPLMLHKGAAQSSVNEKKHDYTKHFINDYKLTNNDLIFVISTSGRNPVPIDVAKYAKECGTKIITISSFAYHQNEVSRHSSGQFLSELGDVNIDNHVPYGDSVYEIKGISHSPVSTIIGMTIMHEIISLGLNSLDIELPVFQSGNISGTELHNKNLIQKYENRIPMLSMNLEG